MGKEIAGFIVNGQVREAIIEPRMTLLDVLRDKLDLMGQSTSAALEIASMK